MDAEQPSSYRVVDVTPVPRSRHRQVLARVVGWSLLAAAVGVCVAALFVLANGGQLELP